MVEVQPALEKMEGFMFFLPAMLALVVSAHAFGKIFSVLRLPRAVGEIFGGFALGPTILGSWHPGLSQWFTNCVEQRNGFPGFFYWSGLVLLMCISGFEVRRTFEPGDRKMITALLLGSTLIPFSAGFFLPLFTGEAPFTGAADNFLALQLILGVATAITSIPVIAKIFIDLGITATRFAKIVLTTAVFHDIILWMALALATGLVSSGGPSFLNIGRTALVTVLFLVCAVTVLPRLFARYGTAQFNILLSFSPPVYVLAVCLLFVLAAYAARIHLVFGAFSAGLCIGSMDEPRLDAGKSLFRKISLAFFVPLYFAMVGIKIDLIRYFDAGLFLFFLFFATVCAGTGTFLAARYAGGGWRTSLDFAVAMNARGILGVVLASEALNLGIINGTFFSVLVMVSIMTTLAAGFWFRCPFFKQRVLRYD